VVDNKFLLWEIPTVKVQTVDTKRRLVFPGAKPGECYAVKESGPGHYELAKVIPAPKKTKPKGAEIDALLVSAGLTPKMNWEQLQVLTREP
jgi:hypothetical protein